MKINSGNKGFTLVELIFVISIIGILATSITINLSRQGSASKDAALMLELDNLRAAINSYRLENKGNLPSTLEELSPNFIRRFKSELFTSKSSFFIDYDNMTGIVKLKLINGIMFDTKGRSYENY